MPWIDDFGEQNQDGLYFKARPAAQDLRAVVSHYWILKCSDTAPRTEEFLSPDGYEELIFSYGGAYARRRCDNHVVERNQGSYIIGAKDSGLFCLRETDLKMVGVKLYPQSLYGFFRIPLSDYFNSTLSLDAFSNETLLQLESKIFDAQDEDEIVAVLDKYLRNLIRSNLARFDGNTHRKVSQSLCSLHRSQGRLSIDALTSDIACHCRSLERLFKLRVGQAPKAYARNLRFKSAFYSFCNNSDKTQDFYSDDFGYYDRSHFNKNFRFYTGSSPSEFLKQDQFSTQVFTASYGVTKEKAFGR